jgi:hypothetical protein
VLPSKGNDYSGSQEAGMASKHHSAAERRCVLKRTAQLRTLKTLTKEISELEVRRNKSKEDIEELSFNRSVLRSLKEAVATWTEEERDAAQKAFKKSRSESAVPVLPSKGNDYSGSQEAGMASKHHPAAERRCLLKRTAQLRTLKTLTKEITELEVRKNKSKEDVEELSFNRSVLRSLKEAVATWTEEERDAAQKAFKKSRRNE